MSAAVFEADFHDGHSSARRRVRVAVSGEHVRLYGDGVAMEMAARDLRIQPRMGGLPLRIGVPGGGLLVADADAVASVLPLPVATGRVHALEKHPRVVIAALLGLVLAFVFAWQVALPWTAERVARHLPMEIEGELARQTLEAVDSVLFHPTDLPMAARERLQAGFLKLARAANAPPVNLEFRKSETLGANALALPGGTIILTDELVKMMDNDDQVMSVLAHEIGHVAHRHLTRQLLQSSMVAVAASMLLGDVSGISGLAATVPAFVLTASYSRDFEREADAFAAELLRRTGRSPAIYAEALERMKKHAEAEHGREPELAKYLSTHPDTDERIRAARALGP